MKRSSSEISEGESEIDLKPEVDDTSPKKKGKRGPAIPKKEKEKGEKGQKTRWTAAEDATLIALIESCITDSLWDKGKAEGSLVHRTGYGCKYHAMMLLRQGTGGSPPKKKQ